MLSVCVCVCVCYEDADVNVDVNAGPKGMMARSGTIHLAYSPW